MTTDGPDRSFGAPRFDVVLRGYDRRQVDEHLSRLQRVLSRMRGELDTARSRSATPVLPGPPTGPFVPPGVRPRPTPRPRPDLPPTRDTADVVGTFTDRMQTILQAAEDEAAEIRAKARSAVRSEEERLATVRATARTEEETARVTLANLVRQRDAVLADLTRVRGQLEALLSGPTARIPVPNQDRDAAARQDAGAGQPLPGTPATPPAAADEPEATALMARPVEPSDTARPEAAPSDTARPDDAPRRTARSPQAPPGGAPPPRTGRSADPGAPSAAEATATVPAHGPAGSPAERSTGTDDAPASTGVSPGEQTMAMAPTQRRDADAADADVGRPDGGRAETPDPPAGAAPTGEVDDTAAAGRPPADGEAAAGSAEGDRPGNDRDRVSNPG